MYDDKDSLNASGAHAFLPSQGQGTPSSVSFPSNQHNVFLGNPPVMSSASGSGVPSNAAMPNELFTVIGQLMEESRNYNERVGGLVHTIRNVAEPYRALVQQLIAERDECRQQLIHIHRVVARYASVQEPVVASDGFTYEKRVLQQYLDDCKHAGQSAISQQTKDVLQETLYPNESLKKFVELLKDLKLPSQTALSSVPSQLAGDEDAKDEGPPGGALVAQKLAQIPVRTAKRDGDETPAGNWQGGKAGGGASGGSAPQRHPCVRIYGLCNFGDDCVYASYPYESCLNYLKGKCRFGGRCQEAHVDVNANQQGGGGGGGGNYGQGGQSQGQGQGQGGAAQAYRKNTPNSGGNAAGTRWKQ